jgi:hypothetical protein
MREMPPAEPKTAVTPAQQRYASWMTDVLVYIVVLNLFVEYAGAVVIDSFSISIRTAILLKLMLDALLGVEQRVSSYFAARQGAVFRVLRALSVFSILFFSKFVILEVVNFVFGDHVELGHFIEIAAIVVSMIVASKVLRVIYVLLGSSPVSSS